MNTDEKMLQELLSDFYVAIRAEQFAIDEGLSEQIDLDIWEKKIYTALDISGYDMLYLVERAENRITELENEFEDDDDDFDYDDGDFEDFLYPSEDFDGDY